MLLAANWKSLMTDTHDQSAHRQHAIPGTHVSHAGHGVTDPVCGMTVDPHTAKHRHTTTIRIINVTDVTTQPSIATTKAVLTAPNCFSLTSLSLLRRSSPTSTLR